MILVRGRGSAAIGARVTSNGRAPSYTLPTSPSAQLTVTADPVARRSVAPSAPTTAGRPSSRATMAAWQVRPPRLVTIAAAVFMTGSQSGLVASATSTSPGRKEVRLCASVTTRTLPEPIFSPTARPVTRTGPLAFKVKVSNAPVARREATVFSILSPFDIHRGRLPGQLRIVVLDADRVIGELEHLAIGETIAFAVGFAGRQVPGAGLAVSTTIDEPQLLSAERAAQHGAVALAEGRFMDVELVRIDLALDDVFAETPGAGHEDHIAKPGFGVEREDDAARRAIRANHFHHPDRQRHFEVVEAVVDAIDDGAVGEDRGEAPAAGLKQIAFAAYIQKALVLASEAGCRQVLGGGRAAHRDRDTGAALLFESTIGCGDLAAEMRRAGGLVNQPAGGCRALRE